MTGIDPGPRTKDVGPATKVGAPRATDLGPRTKDAALRTKVPLMAYLAIGIVFGIVVTKAEVVSWFRIQEMFRFQAFHMYGIIGSAIVTARLSLWLLRRWQVRALDGTPIALAPKAMGGGYRYVFGGALFGVGWALTGACPGPLVALVGSGITVMIATIASAIAGTWTYGWLRPRLPH